MTRVEPASPPDRSQELPRGHQPAPALSIFIPVRDGGSYLAQTLDSLLEQRFSDFEIVIADDGSKDETPEIGRTYAERDARVRTLTLPPSGEVAARNAALTACHPDARYRMNHDSDDLSLPGKLETLVEYLETHPEVDVVGCRADYFFDDGRVTEGPPIELEPDRIRATFGSVNSMIHSATLFRREVFDALGGYREEWRTVDDYDLFSRALLAGFQLANLPDVLHRIRMHPGSIGATRVAKMKLLSTEVGARYDLAMATEHGPVERLGDRLRYWKRVRRARRRYGPAAATQ